MNSSCLKWLLVAGVIVIDLLVASVFVALGFQGDAPFEFALTIAAMIATIPALILPSPSPIMVGAACLIGLLLGLLVGDAILGVPFSGPVPSRPGLMSARLLGPMAGCSVLGIAALGFSWSRIWSLTWTERKIGLHVETATTRNDRRE